MRFEYADGRMPYAMTTSGGSYYLAYDQVGSLKTVADESGNIVKETIYDSFGTIITDSNPTLAIPFGFAGGLHDRDTSLIRFGHRDYDPDTGRWTAKDPILFAGGSTDLYGYCMNDPVNGVDPEGLQWKKHGPNWYDWHYEYSDAERDYLEVKANSLGQGMTDLLVRTTFDPLLFYFQKIEEDINENKSSPCK